MAFHLLDTIRNYFGSELVDRAASYLGESSTGINRGLETVIPVSLAGILHKAENSPESLMNFAKVAMDSGITGKLNSSFTAGEGGVPDIGPSILSSLFGDKFGAVAN
ncbi:MAG: DUF937 domain-containing protein, partial [Chitinophagaceae bacterium]|nr:DUF937 domain-containing protein [Chitinophagaceae bacterium]